MTVAILPMRSLRDGKRRLQSLYTVEERARLVQELFQRVLAALDRASMIEHVVLVSPDRDFIDWAARPGVVTLLQPQGGLNEGLEFARQVVRQRSPTLPLMVLLPDLPLISAGDINAIVALGGQARVVLAPDRHDTGTNALWIPASTALPFGFGEGSLRRHQHSAEALGLTWQCYRSLGTLLDIDTDEDLQLARQAGESVQILP